MHWGSCPYFPRSEYVAKVFSLCLYLNMVYLISEISVFISLKTSQSYFPGSVVACNPILIIVKHLGCRKKLICFNSLAFNKVTSLTLLEN